MIVKYWVIDTDTGVSHMGYTYTPTAGLTEEEYVRKSAALCAALNKISDYRIEVERVFIEGLEK